MSKRVPLIGALIISLPSLVACASPPPADITMQHKESMEVVILKGEQTVCKQILEERGFEPLD